MLTPSKTLGYEIKGRVRLREKQSQFPAVQAERERPCRDTGGPRSIDRFLRPLLNKIEPAPPNCVYIHTVRGIGCKWEPPEGGDHQ